MILGALADFYEVRKDPTYLEQAYRIAQACIAYNSRDGILWERGCGTPDCGDDGPMFKGIFVRNLTALLRASPAGFPGRAALEAFLAQSARAVWRHRSSAGIFDVEWDRASTGATRANAHSAGLDALLAGPPDAEEPADPPEFCVYTDADYRGQGACYPASTEIWMLPAPFQDRITSIRVFPGTCVEVYWDAGYQGEALLLHDHTRNVGAHWNDQITSLRSSRCDP